MTEDKDRSYREWYELFRVEIFNYLKKLTRNHWQTAEDLSQEVWIAFYRFFDEVEPRGKEGVRSWLYLVSKRKFLDQLDKDCTENKILGELIEGKGKERMEEEIITRLLFDETLQELSEEERKLVLCRINDIPLEWAFEGEKVSKNTLRVRCTRAVKKMKTIFGKKCSGK